MPTVATVLRKEEVGLLRVNTTVVLSTAVASSRKVRSREDWLVFAVRKVKATSWAVTGWPSVNLASSEGEGPGEAVAGQV